MHADDRKFARVTFKNNNIINCVFYTRVIRLFSAQRAFNIYYYSRFEGVPRSRFMRHVRVFGPRGCAAACKQ